MRNNRGDVSRYVISVEAAVTSLRMRIGIPFFSFFMKIWTIAWMVFWGIFTFGFLVFFDFILLGAFQNQWLFILLYFGGGELMLLQLAYRILDELKLGRPRGCIYIGKSFKHAYEAQGSILGAVMEVGADGRHYINYINQPNHHVLINGSTSSGKTVTMLTFVARASLVNGLKFLMIDWNGENEEWAKSMNAVIWRVPENFKVNLFKLNGLSKEDRASLAVESLMVAAQLTALQSTRVRSALLTFYLEGMEPSLYDLWKQLCVGPASKTNNVLNQRLRAIQRVIGYEPAEFWEEIFNRNNVISLAGLNESEKTLVVYAIMQRLAELFDKKPELGNSLKLMVILDEAWQFFKREREFDRFKESSLEKVVRLGRKYGFGLVVSTQQVEDVPKVFINSCSLIMLHQQRDASYFGGDILNLDRYETAYVRSAAQGEMILFNRGVSQMGQMWNEYIKVKPLSRREMRKLAAMHDIYEPKVIAEPEMPIEVHESTKYMVDDTVQTVVKNLDMPSVAIYRFLIALFRKGELAEAYKAIKEKGWITSDTTIYGNKKKPSILARAMTAGFVNEHGEPSHKALMLMDSTRIIDQQGMYGGSEEHKAIMRKVILMIQDRGHFAFTTDEKDSFDIGEISAKSKGMWDLQNLTIYECQTNAIQTEIDKGMNKARALNARLVWVCSDQKVLDEIREITNGKCEYLNVQKGDEPTSA